MIKLRKNMMVLLALVFSFSILLGGCQKNQEKAQENSNEQVKTQKMKARRF